jgi:hypothetical protein
MANDCHSSAPYAREVLSKPREWSDFDSGTALSSRFQAGRKPPLLRRQTLGASEAA